MNTELLGGTHLQQLDPNSTQLRYMDTVKKCDYFDISFCIGSVGEGRTNIMEKDPDLYVVHDKDSGIYFLHDSSVEDPINMWSTEYFEETYDFDYETNQGGFREVFFQVV